MFMEKTREKIQFVKLPWFKGTPLQWNEVRFNNGDIYHSYRFFCLQIRIYND